MFSFALVNCFILLVKHFTVLYVSFDFSLSVNTMLSYDHFVGIVLIILKKRTTKENKITVPTILYPSAIKELINMFIHLP